MNREFLLDTILELISEDDETDVVQIFNQAIERRHGCKLSMEETAAIIQAIKNIRQFDPEFIKEAKQKR